MDRAGRCELHNRALEGDLAGVLNRIAAGDSPCAADAQSWTPLHFAAQEQRAEVTETLLRAGAEVDARDAYGNTPLRRAVFTSRGQGQVIGHLLAAGADPDLANTAGVSPRQLAERIANYDVAQFIPPRT
jgi:ankyrin repeat protein